MNFSNRPIYQRRRRVALLIFMLLILVLLGLFLVSLRAGGTGDEQVKQVDTPASEQPPEAIDEQTAAKDGVAVDEGIKE